MASFWKWDGKQVWRGMKDYRLLSAWPKKVSVATALVSLDMDFIHFFYILSGFAVMR